MTKDNVAVAVVLKTLKGRKSPLFPPFFYKIKWSIRKKKLRKSWFATLTCTGIRNSRTSRWSRRFCWRRNSIASFVKWDESRPTCQSFFAAITTRFRQAASPNSSKKEKSNWAIQSFSALIITKNWSKWTPKMGRYLENIFHILTG